METYKLTNDTIDMISDRIGTLYSSLGNTKKDTLRARILLEEALLKYQKVFGTDVDISFRTYHIFSQTRFCVRLSTPSFDPFTLEENPMSFMIKSIMTSFEGVMPTWRYRNLTNEIVFTIRKQLSLENLPKIAIYVSAALILAFIARLTVPQSILSVIVNDYIQPLSDAYAGLFCVMAVLMTLLAITLSIIHIGDIASVGALGGQILKRFYMMSILIVVVLTLPLLPFFHITGGGISSVTVKTIYDVLIGFIPGNLVLPFLEFNSIHIIIIGAMIGFSLLSLGQKGELLSNVLDEFNSVAVLTNSFLNRFIFIYAALKLFSVASISTFSTLSVAGRTVIAVIIGEALIFLFYTIYASLKCHIPAKTLIRSIMPSFVICLSSANLGAAFSAIFDSLSELGVSDDNINLSVNLGSVVFQPASTLMLVISALFMADEYGISISVTWLLMALLLSVILVASMPNIPGAAVSVFTLLFAQLGLPAEALSIMIAANALIQFPTIAVDVWCLQAESLCISMQCNNPSND